LADLRTIIVELDVCDDAKLGGGGGVGPLNVGDGAGRATMRDSWFVARQGAPSSGRG
jgi:hypothetical protein